MYQINLDYPFVSKPRYSATRPNKHLYRLIDEQRESYKKTINEMIALIPCFNKIGITPPADQGQPYWENGWIPPIDSMALYHFLVRNNPKHYIEIGSGNSTKFARRAIVDNNLRTKIISIDPNPRAEIDNLCDQIIRKKCEEVDLGLFSLLEAGDILFIDNSHRMFMNSDATVAFLDILPMLADGVLVEFHDICLPYDYPAEWINRYYSEQYGLACYLLARGTRLEIMLPCKFIVFDEQLMSDMGKILSSPPLDKIEKNGCSFWVKVSGSPLKLQHEAFIYEPDWNATEWLEVVLGYMETFEPDEPVALILPMSGTEVRELSLESAQEAILELASQADLKQFPNIVLIDRPEDLLQTLRDYNHVQWIATELPACATLDGLMGQRFYQTLQGIVGRGLA